MKMHRISTPMRFAMSGIVLSAVAGCAVLTTSQVKEVKTFAKAGAEYTELPGSLAQSYGVLIRDAKLLAVTRHEFGQKGAGETVDTKTANTAWDEIKLAYEQEQELDAAGKRMDAALAVLKSYSQVLTNITSDEYTDALGESATTLGQKMDAATEEYNSKYRLDNPLSPIGGKIGWAVRSAGGILIRHREYQILRDVVKNADPLVEGLMGEIEGIASNQMRAAFVNYQENFLGREFKSVANNSQRLEMGTVSFVYEDFARAKAGVELADRVAVAAKAYRDAHKRLVEITRVSMDLKTAVAEIQALTKEVQAGKKIQSAIKK